MQQSRGDAVQQAALAEMGATKERIANTFHCLDGRANGAGIAVGERRVAHGRSRNK